MRSSIWMAALIAGLIRDDDLSGLRLTVQIPGAVDGPSAGGVLCLGILSALDGRVLPKDFAFTGTILPDGTIGEVGGIVHKMQAAQREGCKRVIIPDYMRLDRDENTHENVDLKRHANSLGMQFCPVENIRQAYDTIHRLHANPAEVDEKLATELPTGLEELLTSRADTTIRAADVIFARLPQSEQQAIRTGPLLKSFFKYHDRARRAFEAGKMFHACDNALMYFSFLKAREKNIHFFESASRGTLADFIHRWDNSLRTTLSAVPDDETTIEHLSRENHDPLAAQLMTRAAYSKAVVLDLDRAVKATVRQLGETNTNNSEKSVFSAVIRLFFFMTLAEMSGRYSGEDLQQMRVLADAVPANCVADDTTLDDVARFFYAAQQSTWQTFDTEVDERSKLLGVPRDVVFGQVLMSDAEFLRLIATNDIHEKLGIASSSGSHRRFLNMLSTHLYASNIASASGMIMKWELHPHLGEGGRMIYGRPQVLSSLLRSSRSSGWPT